MQPTEPEQPSAPEPQADAQAAVEQTSESVDQPVSTSWWSRLWRHGGSSDQSAEEPDSTEAPSTYTLTQEELDRRIQAETDRREAKRHAQALAERRRKLRDEDPWAYAEEDRTAEQHAMSDQQVTTLFASIGAEHDKYALDPLVQSLPADERERIFKLEGAGVGLDGRKLIVTEGLKALEKHWKAEGAREAETRLRRNAAFRKQVLSEFRHGTPEPEFLDGGAPSEGSQRVSDILRDQLRSRR